MNGELWHYFLKSRNQEGPIIRLLLYIGSNPKRSLVPHLICMMNLIHIFCRWSVTEGTEVRLRYCDRGNWGETRVFFLFFLTAVNWVLSAFYCWFMLIITQTSLQFIIYWYSKSITIPIKSEHLILITSRKMLTGIIVRENQVVLSIMSKKKYQS